MFNGDRTFRTVWDAQRKISTISTQGKMHQLLWAIRQGGYGNPTRVSGACGQDRTCSPSLLLSSPPSQLVPLNNRIKALSLILYLGIS